MFTPDTYYIFQPDKWQEQRFSPLAMLYDKATKRSDAALTAHHSGLVVAYRAYNRFVRIIPTHAWKEVPE